MRAKYLSALVLFVFTCSFGQLNAPTHTPQDLSTADFFYENEIDVALRIHNQTLLDAPLLSDGSRGYEVLPDFEIGTTRYTGDEDKDSLIRLREDICNSQAVVIAKAGEGDSFLIHDQQGIVTARSFRIREVMYGSSTVGDTVTVVEFGGSVKQGDTTLRVNIAGLEPFVPGKSYILFLNKVTQHPSTAYFLLGYSRDLVVDNRIYPSRRVGDDIIKPSIKAGDTLNSFAATLAKAQTLGCQHITK